jgi:secreted PhoX family phosphatase
MGCFAAGEDNVDNPHDDLRRRGYAKGAAVFCRGEGVFFGKGELYFACTASGAAGSSQIFRYVPSEVEGQAGEKDQPGCLQLFVESSNDRVLDYADNLVVAPWGHVILCEDRYSDTLRNHLRGVTPSGKVYTLGRNVFPGNSEFAGACFSPDGGTMFVNIQNPGITLAITGPGRPSEPDGRRRSSTSSCPWEPRPSRPGRPPWRRSRRRGA